MRKKETQPWSRPKPKMWDTVKEPVKIKSQKTELRLSREIGFKLTPGSGNQCWPKGKGDGSLPTLMFEHKETAGSSISVNALAIGKLYKEATTVGKDPVLLLSVHGMPEPLPKEWAAIPVGLFKAMLGAYLKEQDGDF